MDDELADILQAPPDPQHPYVYRDTATHINKFGIINPDALERVVRVVTGLRQQLLRQKPIQGDFDFDHLCAIHRFLFQDIYEWAGQIRIIEFDRNGMTVPTEQLRSMTLNRETRQKHGPPFGRRAEIVAEVNRILEELRQENHLGGLELPQFSERMAYYLRDLFRVHPFRDGNGRTMRNFLWHLADVNGYVLSMDGVSQLDRHTAAFYAHCGDMEPLLAMMRQSLSKKG